jgi:putative membrane protein
MNGDAGHDAGPDVGRDADPDVRFTYANERTFLAWNRTSLALIAAGLAVVSFLPDFEWSWGARAVGVPLIALGAILSITSYRRWEANERAMRLGQPLPPSNLPRVLAFGIGVASAIAAIVALVGTAE